MRVQKAPIRPWSPADPTALEPSTHTSADFRRNGRLGRFERPRAHCRAERSKDPRPARKSQAFVGSPGNAACCMTQSQSALICASHPLRPSNRAWGGRVFCTLAQTAAPRTRIFPMKKSKALTPPARANAASQSQGLLMRFQSPPLPRSAQNRSRSPPPQKKKSQEREHKKKNKNRQGREAHRVGKAPRRLTRFGFFFFSPAATAGPSASLHQPRQSERAPCGDGTRRRKVSPTGDSRRRFGLCV